MSRFPGRHPRWHWCLMLIAAVASLNLTACGDTSTSSNLVTNPPGQGSITTTTTPAPAVRSSARTVLSPLGLNIHASPQLTAAVLGTATQGVSLTVVDRSEANGGWFKVQGQTLTGWIVADPALTAPGLFTSYQSTQRLISVLYPQDWTFAEEPADVLFHPVAGPQTIVVRSAAHTADFGSAGAQGFLAAGQRSVVVCGVTGDLNQYTSASPIRATPTPGTAGPLGLFAQLRLRLDASHALDLEYNYAGKADLQHFEDFYNSMTFPFPQCQAPAPAPSPT